VLSMSSARNTTLYDGRPPCAGNSICIPVCPIGAKYDAGVHVKKAIQAGVTLRERAVVSKLIIGENNCITGVTFKNWDATEETVSGRLVILAVNAIETPKILLMSNAANSSNQVGKNLMDHLGQAALGLAPEPLFPFRGPPSVAGIEVFRDGASRKDHAAFRISLGNDGWSRKGAPYSTISDMVTKDNLFGDALQEKLAFHATRQFRLSSATEVLPSESNYVTLSDKVDALGIQRPELHFKPDDYTIAGLKKAADAMLSIMTLIGATEVQPIDPLEYSGAGHIMGTCRMGDKPESSVVNGDSRSHDHPNLYIVGSSVFTTVGTGNPTLTIAALSLRAAEKIAEVLAGGVAC